MPEAKAFSASPTTLQLVEPVTGDTYSVVYQAKHPKVLFDVLTQDILLPEILVPAFEAYVAHLILSPKNGQEHAVKSAEYFAKYEMVCSEIIDKDLVSTSLALEGDKLSQRGFR